MVHSMLPSVFLRGEKERRRRKPASLARKHPPRNKKRVLAPWQDVIGRGRLSHGREGGAGVSGVRERGHYSLGDVAFQRVVDHHSDL